MLAPLCWDVDGSGVTGLAFSFATAPRLVAAPGASEALAPVLAGLGVTRVAVVTDAGLVRAGLLERPLAALAVAGLAPVVFDGVVADPPVAAVDGAVAMARAAGCDGVLGFGGGSSMDVAKLAALLLRSPQPVDAIFGIGLARGPRLPLVQVPTTAGTGSEVTDIAILTTPDHAKRGVVAPQLMPDAAVLDARLTLSLPAVVTAATGVDAMVHAIEAYTSRRKKNPVSDALAREALWLLAGHVRRACVQPDDLAAREAMLLGASLAGMAFANAPVAAVHALAYPLGGRFGVSHGLSNALMLNPVLRFNQVAARREYAELARVLLPDARFADAEVAAEAFVVEIGNLVQALPMARRLAEVGVRAADLEQLATDALEVQRLLVNNPRDVTLADARALYAEVL
jgi:alcohol dehydrogenase class IV